MQNDLSSSLLSGNIMTDIADHFGTYTNKHAAEFK